MNIKNLPDYRVIQRTGSATAIDVNGECAQAGPVQAKIARGSEVILDWTIIGVAQNGAWQGVLPAVPTGGEYRIDVRIFHGGSAVESASADHILVGDLWILAGQSNMQGIGNMIDIEPPSPQVHVFEMQEVWSVAQDVLHWLHESPCGAYWRNDQAARDAALAAGRGNPTKGAGLGVAFGKDLAEHTGVPIGLIPCALGGTQIKEWDPKDKHLGTTVLYGAMLHRVNRAGGKVKGLLWYQGESDAVTELSPLYSDRLKELAAATRLDLNDPNLPWIQVQICRTTLGWLASDWNAIQNTQRVVEKEINRLWTVPSVDLELDDAIHVGTDGLKRLGRRLARVARREVYGEPGINLGPRPISVTIADAQAGAVRVTYGRVNGGLNPKRHIAGFSFLLQNGDPGPPIYNVSVDRNDPRSVIIETGAPLPGTVILVYGHGIDPYCNLVDDLDMAAPVFGTLVMSAPVA